MTRSDGSDEEIWGTREELLLACAVSRHGTQSWDSVAMEVQARSPFSHLLTAQTCKRRYHDIQRRFAAESRGIDGAAAAESGAISLLEALRRIRVAELRREVERYDDSIGSLQLKVKRLKEDRERSLQEEQSGDRSDPPEVEGAKKETGSPAANRAIDGESGRSCNESNSTEPKGGQDPRAAEDGQLDGAAGGLRADPAAGDEEKLAGEGSYNGSSDTVAKGGAEAATPAEEPATAKQPDAGESGESVAESKGEASKESSDVQSSASLSRRRRGRRKAASGGSSGGEDAEADEVSPVRSGDAAKSQPLASFLQMILSHKHGSVFERRLESQESARYRSLIRQHMDLGIVHSKMEEGAYAADVEFYRDVLLACTNAVVFFPTNSAEHTAAVQLRELVRKEIPAVIQKPVPVPVPVPVPAPTPTATPPPVAAAAAEEPAAPPPPPAPPAARQPVATKMKTEPDPPGAPLDQPIAAPPLVACRKRSSISGKAAAKAVATVKAEEKPEPDKIEIEKETERKRTKERSAVVGTRGLRTSKGRGSNSGASAGPNKNSSPASGENAVGIAKAERKNTSGNNAANTPASSVAKKRSAMNNFLTRMNRSGASSNGTLLETLKSSGGGGGKGVGEQRKGGRTEGRKEARQGSSVAGSSGKQAREQSPPVKRSVGRPPKRPPPPLPPPPAKRTREVEAAAPPPTRTAAAKKRGRR